jgi:hypothetical protein
MATYVLVHGAWSGAHGFRHVRRLLQTQGHEVFTPSLTGIGERVHLVSPQVDLTTHVHDVVNQVLYEDLDQIVLLGFSYGGMVVTDDFVYAEPTAATNAQPAITATAGLTFNGLVATFSDLDPNGVAGNFTATIDWGDGHISPGVITPNANGGFNISGSNTYAGGGNFPVKVEIADFLGSSLSITNVAAVSGTGQVLNISTRARVETGDNVLFGGFIIGSATSTSKVIVRALGPSLTAFGVPGALTDPTLELHDGNGVTIATNDNWKVNDLGGSQQAEVEATTIPPTSDLESALVRTLTPGNYTAIVRDKNGGTGVALVEVYNLLQ